MAALLNYKHVLGLCGVMDAMQRKAAVRYLLCRCDAPEELSPSEALLLWTYDACKQATRLSDAAVMVVLQQFTYAIADYGHVVADAFALGDERVLLPELKIGFLDAKYAACDGVPYFVDLTTGDRVKALPRPPFCTTSYNLCTLFVDRMTQYRKMTRPSPAGLEDKEDT